MRSSSGSHLFQAVNDGDQEAHVWNSFVVQVSHSFHQLRGRRHWRDKKEENPQSPDQTANSATVTILPLSVRMCRQRVTRVSAPLGQFSTSSSSSGDFMPIPRIYEAPDQIKPSLNPYSTRRLTLTGCSMARSTLRLMSAMASV